MAAKITVRELITKLTIGGNAGDKLAKFGLQVNGIKAALDIMVGAVKIASAATLGLVDDVTQTGDAVAKTAREIGISAKSLQRLSFVADRSGVPMQNLKKGLQNIERNLRDATIAAGKGQGTGFSAALAEVGIRLKEFEGLNPEEKLGLIGDALSQVSDEGRRVALSQKLVGEEAGPKLASLLEMTTAEIKAMGDEAERLGLVMSDDALDASEAFQDSMTNMNAVLKGIKTNIGIALIPIVKKAVDGFGKWLLLNKKFITSNFEKFVKVLTESFASLALKLEDIIDTFRDLAKLSSDVIEFFKEMTDLVGGLENAIKLAAIAWGVYRAAALAATVGLALTPIGLLGLALAGVAAAFLLIETNADKARSARIRFQAVKSTVDKPVNERQAKLDANAVAMSALGGRKLSKAVRKRLASGSGDQATRTFSVASRFLRFGKTFDPDALGGLGGERRIEFGGKFGRGKGDESGLDRIIEQTRRDRAAARDAEANEALMDEIFAENISGISPVASASGGGGRRSFSENLGNKGPKDSLADLLAAAIKSGSLPESAALLASTQPPIIIPITNNTFTVAVEATSVFEGVSGEASSEFVERAEEVFTDMIGGLMNDTMDQVRSQLAR